MAYGDNRNVLGTDDFASGIGADWDNGWGTWDPLAAGASGTVQPSAVGVDCAMRRITEEFTGDHWTQIEATSNLGDTGLALLVRCHPDSATDESCYYGFVGNFSADSYEIYEVDSNEGFTQLTSTSGGPLTSGDTLTMEAEGTTLRLGSNEGAGDAQRVTTTDNTLSGATYTKVGLDLFVASGNASSARVTAWTGGSIGAGGGGTEGTLAATLAALTAVGAGTVTISGTADIDLAAATSDGAGSVEIEGVADETLEAVTLGGLSTVDIDGTLDADLEDVTLEATDSGETSGSLDQQLDDLTLDGIGTVDINGTLDTVLAANSLESDGVVSIEGTLDETLDSATVESAGVFSMEGTLAVTLAAAFLFYEAAAGTITSIYKSIAQVIAKKIGFKIPDNLAD